MKMGVEEFLDITQHYERRLSAIFSANETLRLDIEKYKKIVNQQQKLLNQQQVILETGNSNE